MVTPSRDLALDDLNLRDLHYFVACCEGESLSRVADHLHVAQPTLSHALARLEERLGGPLIERRRRHPLRLTERGEALLARARQAIAAIDALRGDLEATGELRGSLRLGSIQSLNLSLMPQALARFANAHPRVRVELSTYQAPDVPEALRRDRIDLAVVAGAPAPDLRDLACTPLADEAFVVIARRDHPLAAHRRIALADLAPHDLVLVAPSTFTGQVVAEALDAAGVAPRIRLQLTTGETLRETVRAGLGATILPTGYLAPGDRDLVAIAIRAPTPHRRVLLLEDPSRPRSRAASAMAELLRELAADLGARPAGPKH